MPEPPAPPADRDRAPAEPAAKKQGWFQRLKAGLTKTSAKLSQDIAGIFTKRKLDADTLRGARGSADPGGPRRRDRHAHHRGPGARAATTRRSRPRRCAPCWRPRSSACWRRWPSRCSSRAITARTSSWSWASTAPARPPPSASWRSASRQEGKKVTLAAGDTFRAAAIEQLKIWGERTGAEVVARGVGADAAGLAFDALKRARENASDVLLIDTAGRLQNKQALMDELEKVIRVLRKIDPKRAASRASGARCHHRPECA